MPRSCERDGIHDGILGPPAPNEKPPGYVSGPYPEDGYFQAVPMTSTGGGNYTLTLPATKTGAYRLSARYRVTGDSAWRWYGASGYRDHCITVAPKSARDMRVYEINVFNVDATGPTFAQRSTLESLTDSTRWNLTWLRNLGANTLWFQPPERHWDEPSADGESAHDPGSPCGEEFLRSTNSLRTTAPTPSRQIAPDVIPSSSSGRDAEGVLMLDAPFSHTS